MGFPTTSLREALWVKMIFLRCHFSFVLMVPKQRWDKLLVPLRECWGSGPKLGQWSWRYSPPNRQRNNKKPNVQTKAMSISLTNVIDTALKVINFMETWVHLFLMLCMKMWEVLIHINRFCHPVAYAGFLEGTLLCDWVVSDARCLPFETLFFYPKTSDRHTGYSHLDTRWAFSFKNEWRESVTSGKTTGSIRCQR